MQTEPTASSDAQQQPDQPVEPVIPERNQSDIDTYNSIKRKISLSSIAISLVYWLVWCFLADDFIVAISSADSSRWVTLGLAGLVFMGGSVLVGLPLTYYSSFVVEHRFSLSNQSMKDWWVFQLKSWLIGAVLGAVILAGLYACLWYAGPLWGVFVWAGMMLLSVVLAKVFPLVILPLFYPSQPLDRPSLNERLRSMASEAGMTITGIYDLALSKDTKKANAMLAGLGSSRRVYLADTLLQAFEDDEISVVFAHELGHHIRGHILKGIALSAVVSSIVVGLMYWRLSPFGGVSDAGLDGWQGAIAALAEVMLILSIFPLVIGPVTNGIMRYFERQADTDALRLTNDPEAYKGAFEKLGQLNLDELNPPRWEVIMFDDHPPLGERIAMAEQWAQNANS